MSVNSLSFQILNLIRCLGSLHPPSTKIALVKLRAGEKLDKSIGSFARLILLHTLYSSTASLRNVLKYPYLEDWQTADFWSKWISGTLASIENMKLDLKSGEPTGLQWSLECHICMAKALLFTPKVFLLPLAHSRNSPGYANAKEELLRWIAQNKGRTARRAVMYSAILLDNLRSNRTSGYYEAIAGHFATLTLWAYAHLTAPALAHTREGRYTATVRLDSTEMQDDIFAWINGDESLRAHIKEIGNIRRLGVEKQILNMGRTLLDAFSTWGIKDIITLGIVNIDSNL